MSLDQRIDWQREYENLCREALQANSHRGHGLALFLSRGMRAWLEALTALESRSLARSTEQESVDLAPLVRSDLTRLLANMVMSCIGTEEAHGPLQ